MISAAKAKRTRWSEDELNILTSLWDKSTGMPGKATMDKLCQLINRPRLTIRAQASNLLKKLK